jgi:NitT/TauT family transport system permease protein
MATPRRYHHHYRLIYTHSLKRHLGSLAIVLVTVTLVSLYLFSSISPSHVNTQFSFKELIEATIASSMRLLIAYFLALIFSVPLAILITATPKLERLLLPFFDVLESVPVLAFFPIIVLLFIKINYFDGAAIFILFMAMIWNLVFSMVGGINIIPEDIKEAAYIFKARGLKKLFSITLPAIFPFIVTGSLLAWAQGWNILIVAEVLHNYIPGGSSSSDRLGLGSLLVNASLQGNKALFIGSLGVMILVIALMNLFIWQKLLKLAERYKFE